MKKSTEFFKIVSTFMPDDMQTTFMPDDMQTTFMPDDMQTDLKDKTDQGLDSLDLMLRFVRIFQGKRPEQDYNRLKSWLVQQLKRGLTDQEDLNLSKGIHDYMISSAQTPERIEAMNYLFDAKFLE